MSTWRRQSSRAILRERFDNPDFDAGRFDADMRDRPPCARAYVIVFTPRSGSSWLARALAGSGLHGKPQEYFNADRIAGLPREVNGRDAATTLAMLTRKQSTPNGVFGLKATAYQIERFGEEATFAALPPGAVLYLLWRRNIAAQGVSLYRAVESRVFHSSGASPAAAPAYDAPSLRRWIRHVLHIENENCLLARRHSLPLRVIDYESIAGDREAALRAFADVAPVAEIEAAARGGARRWRPKTLEKLGDSWNKDAEARLRAADAAFLWLIERLRLVRHVGPPRVQGWRGFAQAAGFALRIAAWRLYRAYRAFLPRLRDPLRRRGPARPAAG